MKRFIPLTIFLGLAVFLYIGLSLNPRELPSPFIDKPFPQVLAQDFKVGNRFSLTDYLKGKVSFVNVWASWCITCRAEHKMLLKLREQNNIHLIGINYKDEKIPAKKFLVDFGNPFHKMIYDRDGKAGLDLGVYATPESFIVDKLGIIRYKKIGEITEKTLSKEINPLIAKLNAQDINKNIAKP